MTISKTLRFEILARDGFQCLYCGRGSPAVALQVDHFKPVAVGGTDDPSNLVTACEDCNQGKSDRTLCAAGAVVILSKDRGPARMAKAMAAKFSPSAADPNKHWITSGILDVADEDGGNSLVLVHCESHGCDEWHWIDSYVRETIQTWGAEPGWVYGKAG